MIKTFPKWKGFFLPKIFDPPKETPKTLRYSLLKTIIFHRHKSWQEAFHKSISYDNYPITNSPFALLGNLQINRLVRKNLSKC